MGGGMLQRMSCEDCDGTGKVYDKDKAYSKAIEDIKKLDANISDDEAKKIFDEEMDKLNQDEKNDKEEVHEKRKSKRK